MRVETREILHFNVKGMTCGGCVRGVQQALDAVNGVIHSEVQVGRAMAIIDSTRVNASQIEAVLRHAGYVPELVEIDRD